MAIEDFKSLFDIPVKKKVLETSQEGSDDVYTNDGTANQTFEDKAESFSKALELVDCHVNTPVFATPENADSELDKAKEVIPELSNPKLTIKKSISTKSPLQLFKDTEVMDSDKEIKNIEKEAILMKEYLKKSDNINSKNNTSDDVEFDTKDDFDLLKNDPKEDKKSKVQKQEELDALFGDNETEIKPQLPDVLQAEEEINVEDESNGKSVNESDNEVDKEEESLDSEISPPQETIDNSDDSKELAKEYDGEEFTKSKTIQKLRWILKSPSLKWEGFYKEKAKLLSRMLVDGELPLSQYRQDLIDAKVEVSSTSYSLQSITEKMQQVQQWRERVKEIQIRVTDQYFLWNRMQPMMRGLLAGVEYAKPVEKHGGLIYEHMRDVEEYYARLESMHYGADMVSKTLDKASDTLSRLVTVLLPTRGNERYSGLPDSQSGKTSIYNEPTKEVVKDEELDEYDELLPEKKEEFTPNKLDVLKKPTGIIKGKWGSF